MTPPFPEICKKDLVVTVSTMPRDLILEKFLVSCKEEEGGGGLALSPPFLAADIIFQFTYKILIYHWVSPPPTFMGAGNKWK